MKSPEKIIPDISIEHREETLNKIINKLTDQIISDYLSDGKLFQREAENKITVALKKISSEEKTSDTLTKIKTIHQAIITFSSYKIRLVENLTNKQRTDETIVQLNDTLLDLTTLLNIDFNTDNSEASAKDTLSQQENE